MATVASKKNKPIGGKSRRPAKGGDYKLVRDASTGLVVTRGPDGAPRVTSEQIKNLLANFP